MPNAARVLTLIVSLCYTVHAGRLSMMSTHFLRHFAHNHASQNKAIFKYGRPKSSFQGGTLAKKPIQLPSHMRFKNAMRFKAEAPELPSPYTYASPTGNGNKDLMTPYYGHFASHYGPVYQLLTPVSGYGGYPGTVDPRGFNAPTQNFTAGVLVSDFQAQPGKPNVLGKNSALTGRPIVGQVPGIVPGLVPAGSMFPFVGAHVTQAQYLPGAPGVHQVVGQISGTIPVMYPNGGSKGMTHTSFVASQPGMALNGFANPASPLQAVASNVARGNIFPMDPLRAAASGVGFRSPYNPAFSMGMMQHHQLTLNGASNGFVTPGFFRPLSDNYPTPDMDRYSSVRSYPVLPPNYGQENKGSGSGSG